MAGRNRCGIMGRAHCFRSVSRVDDLIRRAADVEVDVDMLSLMTVLLSTLLSTCLLSTLLSTLLSLLTVGVVDGVDGVTPPSRRCLRRQPRRTHFRRYAGAACPSLKPAVELSVTRWTLARAVGATHLVLCRSKVVLLRLERVVTQFTGVWDHPRVRRKASFGHAVRPCQGRRSTSISTHAPLYHAAYRRPLRLTRPPA
jgi:hypothetical protein